MNSQKKKEKSILKKRKKKHIRKINRGNRKPMSSADFLAIIRKDMQKWNWNERKFVLPDAVSPHIINDVRVIQAQYLTQRQLSAPSSRMVLHEFNDSDTFLQIDGLVSDIEVCEKKPSFSRLLIEYPTITGVGSKALDRVRGVRGGEKSIDSHIWICLDDLTFVLSRDSIKVSIGDNIRFFATVKTYRGRGDYAMKGYKYGLTEIGIVDSGIYTYHQNDRSTVRCRNNYPRGKDWVVSAENLEDGKKIMVQKSLYPSYRERMNIEDNRKN